MNRFIEMLKGLFEDGEKKRLENYDPSITNRRDIIRYENIKYGEDSVWNTLDVYRCQSLEGKVLPVLVNVHGGGWIYGDKKGYRYYCESLADKGYVVVNINYHLVDSAYFPKPMEDLNEAMNWIYENGQNYLMDIDHIFALGDSAGAHILGAYTCACSNEEYAKLFSFSFIKHPFEAMALNCGVYFVHFDEKKTDFVRMLALNYLNLENIEKEKISSERLREYNSKIDRFEFIKYINNNYPDTFVMSAQYDFVRMHSAALVSKLTQEGINMEYRMYGSKNHKLEHVFHTDLNLPEALLCNEDEIRFFKNHTL